MKFSLTLLLGLSLGAMAQEPPAPGTPVPQPGVPAPVPATLPVAPTGGGIVRGRTVDPNGLVVTANDFIQEANITALRAAQMYEDYSGKRVIMTNAVAQSEVSFTMRGPLTNGEAARFLQLTLLAEGLAMMPIPEEPEIVRLIPSGPITAPGQVPKELYFDEFELPVEDQLVMYQMIFRYLKPEEALKVLQSAMGQLSASGTIAAVPNASSLIITESASLIRQMIKIQKAIDVPTPVGEKWVEVTYGDVDEIAERMNEIYNEQGNTRQTTRTTRANTPPNPGTTPGAATSGEDIPLRIIGVRRTSRILLVGRPTDLIAAQSMIESFDKPSSGNTRQTFRLRYMRVSDFLTIAENGITAILSDGATTGAGGAGGGRQLSSQNNNSRNTQSNRSTNNQSTGQQGGQGGQGGGTRTNIEAQNIPTYPESLLVGRTLLVADNVANTIVVNGPPHHIEIVRDLIGDLDTEAQQVALSAVVGSYGLGDDMNFGLDLAQALQESGSNFAAAGASSFGGVPALLPPSALATLGDLLTANGNSGNGLSLYGFFGDDFGVFINALETQTKFKTLERTVLTTRNNRVASLSSGQKIAIPSGTFSGGVNQGGTQTQINYENVVLEIDIQPLINSDNQVTLEISLVRDSVGLDRVVGELTVPDINTESLTTSVTVEDGSAVILGGIMTTMTSDTQKGVPFLSRIPGIGRLFGSTGDSTTESELIVMIQPRIINSQGDFDNFREDYGQSTLHTNAAYQNFPANRGFLPPRGTMPASNDSAKGGGVVPVKTTQPTKVDPPKKRRTAGRKKSYLR